MAKGRSDPNAKRRDETYLQWRSRLARQQETARRQGEDIVTPETLAQGGLERAMSPDQERARTYRRTTKSSLARLKDRGVITDEQHASALEIAEVVERIERGVGVASASLAARVDCSGGRYDPHMESLHRVRMERAYSAWRRALPLPRRMFLDMVTEDHQLAMIARRHNRSWVWAIRALKECLDTWPDERKRAFDAIDQDDLDRAVQKVA